MAAEEDVFNEVSWSEICDDEDAEEFRLDDSMVRPASTLFVAIRTESSTSRACKPRSATLETISLLEVVADV